MYPSLFSVVITNYLRVVTYRGMSISLVHGSGGGKSKIMVLESVWLLASFYVM